MGLHQHVWYISLSANISRPVTLLENKTYRLYRGQYTAKKTDIPSGPPRTSLIPPTPHSLTPHSRVDPCPKVLGRNQVENTNVYCKSYWLDWYSVLGVTPSPSPHPPPSLSLNWTTFPFLSTNSFRPSLLYSPLLLVIDPIHPSSASFGRHIKAYRVYGWIR